SQARWLPPRSPRWRRRCSPMDPPKNSKWFHERLGPSEGHVHEVRTVLLSRQTPFQHIEIVELGDYGRSMILDGKVQSTQAVEFIYHEVIVHLAMLVFLYQTLDKVIVWVSVMTLRVLNTTLRW